MARKRLHIKVVSMIVVILALFITLTSYLNYRYEVNEHMENKIESMALLAHLIQNTIYEDMLAGRADLARKVIESINTSNTEGHSNRKHDHFVQIIRNNGVERAFGDLKTIESVTAKLPNLSQATWLRWLENHTVAEPNIAPKTNSPQFKEAFAKIKKDWKTKPLNYIDENTDELIYLQPIEERKACLSCHEPTGGRGVLMIAAPMAGERSEMITIATTYTTTGIILILILAISTSIIIKKSITGPLSETIKLMDKVTQDENHTNTRLLVKSDDEIGLLAKRFNSMLDSIQSRESTLKTLFKSIEASQQEWRTIFDSIHELLSVYDFQGKLIKCNMSFALRLNKKPQDLIGKNCEDLLTYEMQDERDKITGNWSNPKIVRTEQYFKNLSGTFNATRIPKFDNKGNVVATILVLRDVSEEKELKRQLLQSEKMKSIGQLVAGIAHELNNPLMGITGYSEILMDSPPETPLKDIKPKVEKIYQEALRTAKIVQQLLIFARAKEVQRSPHNVNDLIKDTVELKESAAGEKNIKIKTDLSPHIGKTFIDYYQLQQVFINIINNGIDAIREISESGTIEITSKLSGRTIYVKFKDSGTGMPAEVLEKVFDPFFSTKEVGKGTGLGLSISHGIIKDHGGWIDIKSTQGEGTTITIELPIDTPPSEVDNDSEEAKMPHVGSSHRGESALVVDDEPNIREFIADAIANEGLQVDTARNGYEALELIENKKYSIIITDIKMPGMGGHEIYNVILEKYKYLSKRVLLLTGDVFSEDIKEFIKDSGCPHLLKPFELKALIKLVNSIIDK